MTEPSVPSTGQLRATAAHLAEQQQPDGLIPWFAGHYGDPWDHVEAAMALTASGLIARARSAYAWSAEHQAADGSWPMQTAGIAVREASVDANQCAYIAVGLWHHWQVTRDRDYVRELWPMVRAAIGFVLELQQPWGGISWSRDASGQVDLDTLLTSSACMVLSLRCASALADLAGDPQPDWELAAGRLAHAVAVHPDRFADRSRYSMDWYYPVLGGAVRGPAARALLHSRWDEFAVTGKGIRCVADRPWVTVAETCELALSLDAIDDTHRAEQLLRDVQFLRDTDGGYWTGWVFGDDAVWPEEKCTWTSAAVILVADAITRGSGGHALFHGDGLPRLVGIDRCDEHCYALSGRKT